MGTDLANMANDGEKDEETQEDSEPDSSPEAAEDGTEAEEAAAPDEGLSRVDKLENERTDLMNRLTRSRADLSNLKRRSEQELQEFGKFANQLFATDVLRVVDSLDRALQAIPENIRGFTWIDGLLVFRAQIDSLLKSQGVEEVKAMGEKFDPRYHEAVAQDGESGSDGVVQEVFQAGYTMHDRLLRPALVKVGSAEAEEEEAGDEDVVETSATVAEDDAGTGAE